MKKYRQTNLYRKKYILLFMALPFFILVLMFNYMPLFGWIFSLFKFKPGVPLFQSPFVGFKYFNMVFTDRVDMLRVMKNTISFALIGYLFSPFPVILAMLLNEVKLMPFKKLVQTTTTLPNFISWIIVYSLAFSIFSTSGVLNELLMRFGIIDKPTNILGNADHVYLVQGLLTLWKSLGWNAIIYMAAISSIPSELYDAAKVDGAGRFRLALHVTLPGLMPTFIVLLLLSVGSFVGVGFDQYFIFKNPMTADAIEVIDVYVYRIGLINNDYSYGVAIGIMKSIVSIMLLFVANGIAKKVRGTAIV